MKIQPKHSNKKGISPLIATVLLIGFTIVLAALVMRWGGTLFKTTTSQTGCESQGRISCSSQIQISVGNLFYTENSGALTVVVNNEAATQSLKGFNIQRELNDGTIQNQKVTDPTQFPLAAGQSANLAPPNNFVPATVGSVKQFHITPIFDQVPSDGNQPCEIVCTEQKTTLTVSPTRDPRVTII